MRKSILLAAAAAALVASTGGDPWPVSAAFVVCAVIAAGTVLLAWNRLGTRTDFDNATPVDIPPDTANR